MFRLLLTSSAISYLLAAGLIPKRTTRTPSCQAHLQGNNHHAAPSKTPPRKQKPDDHKTGHHPSSDEKSPSTIRIRTVTAITRLSGLLECLRPKNGMTARLCRSSVPATSTEHRIATIKATELVHQNHPDFELAVQFNKGRQNLSKHRHSRSHRRAKGSHWDPAAT